MRPPLSPEELQLTRRQIEEGFEVIGTVDDEIRGEMKLSRTRTMPHGPASTSVVMIFLALRAVYLTARKFSAEAGHQFGSKVRPVAGPGGRYECAGANYDRSPSGAAHESWRQSRWQSTAKFSCRSAYRRFRQRNCSTSPIRTAMLQERHLSAEQRRAFELLAGAQRGLTEATWPRVHGFTFELLAGLVHNGLAAVATATARAGGRKIKVARIASRRLAEGHSKAIPGAHPRPS